MEKFDRKKYIWNNFKDEEFINYYCIEENNYFYIMHYQYIKKYIN